VQKLMVNMFGGWGITSLAPTPRHSVLKFQGGEVQAMGGKYLPCPH